MGMWHVSSVPHHRALGLQHVDDPRCQPSPSRELWCPMLPLVHTPVALEALCLEWAKTPTRSWSAPAKRVKVYCGCHREMVLSKNMREGELQLQNLHGLWPASPTLSNILPCSYKCLKCKARCTTIERRVIVKWKPAKLGWKWSLDGNIWCLRNTMRKQRSKGEYGFKWANCCWSNTCSNCSPGWSRTRTAGNYDKHKYRQQQAGCPAQVSPLIGRSKYLSFSSFSAMIYFLSFLFFFLVCFLLPTEVQHKKFQRKQRNYKPKVLKRMTKLPNMWSWCLKLLRPS
jgi:hypothetical protein